MKKGIGLIILAFLMFNSVYFQKLSERKKSDQSDKNFASKVDSILQIGILKNPLVTDQKELINQLNNNLTNTKEKLGNRLGIGESAYYLVKGSATITEVNSGQLKLSNGSTIETTYIFGNEIRDASRMVKLSDFKSQKDLNLLTENLNKALRERIIPAQIKNLKVGNQIHYIGACEVSPVDLPIQKLTIYPVEIRP